MSDRRDDQDEPENLAAEYAAGLLEGGDFHEARRLTATDRSFAQKAARWRGRLSGLLDEIGEVAPPAALWKRIEAALGNRSAVNDDVEPLRRKLMAWRSATAGMTALAAALGLILVLQPRASVAPPSPQSVTQPPMVALISDKDVPKLMVSWDPSAKQLVFAVAGRLPGDVSQSHELWVIPRDGTPRSLGVLPGGAQSHKRIADTLASLLQQGATIAISVEPHGGSPTGKPTGPVIASGSLKQA